MSALFNYNLVVSTGTEVIVIPQTLTEGAPRMRWLYALVGSSPDSFHFRRDKDGPIRFVPTDGKHCRNFLKRLHDPARGGVGMLKPEVTASRKLLVHQLHAKPDVRLSLLQLPLELGCLTRP